MTTWHARCRAVWTWPTALPARARPLTFSHLKQRAPPILVFIHGGYWIFNSKDTRRFPAREFVPRGIAWVPMNYRLAPTVPMGEIVADVRNAVQWLYHHAAEYGCDPERIYVSGNSAGGHLTAELLSDDWPDQYGLPADVVKGACAISGLYDLEPLLECEPNEKLRMDLETARRYSPIYHLSAPPTPVITACGADESAEFRRQTGAYAEVLKKAGHVVTHIEVTGHDHFSVIGEIANPESPLFRAVTRMIFVKRLSKHEDNIRETLNKSILVLSE